jgi:hypothetical protein
MEDYSSENEYSVTITMAGREVGEQVGKRFRRNHLKAVTIGGVNNMQRVAQLKVMLLRRVSWYCK